MNRGRVAVGGGGRRRYDGAAAFVVGAQEGMDEREWLNLVLKQATRLLPSCDFGSHVIIFLRFLAVRVCLRAADRTKHLLSHKAPALGCF